MESVAPPPAPPTLLATDHELFVGDLIDQMRKQRQEKSRSYRHLPYFHHLGSEEVFEALDRVRQANLLQMQLKMQKDCSYMQHMDDMSLEGRNAETVRKRVQEGKLQGGFRQVQSHGTTTVCGCLDCQLRLGNKQFNSSFQYEQSKDTLAQKVQKTKLTFLGAAGHGKPMLTMHLVNEGGAPDSLGTALHAAVLRGDTDLTRLLCSRPECDSGLEWNGVTPLDLAVAKNCEDGGDVLLQHGAPLSHFRQETLHEAVDRGGTLLLRALLQQRGIFPHQSPFASPAGIEAVNGAGADGNTPLHLACTLPDREAAVRVLVVHAADASRENAEGLTPLDCCVQAASRGAWRALRQATGGQAKYRRYEAEQRSLRAAVASNCLFLVRNLHLRQEDDRKADRQKVDLGEMLHLAVSTSGVTDDMVQYLVEQGADVNAAKDGLSVLDACLQHNIVNESALGKHAKLSKYQDYTLRAATQEGLTGLVRYLANTARKGGKDGANQREAGLLPLHVAASKGFVDVVKVLLKCTGSVHEQTDEGKTALDLACEELSRCQPAGDRGGAEDELCMGLCRTVDALLSRGCRLKEFKEDSQLERAMAHLEGEAEELRREAQEVRDRDEARAETRKQARRRREERDDAAKQAEREIRVSMAEEERKADSYKESEKLAKKVAESREVLQASWKVDGEKLPEYLSSKYYQIRIDVLRRKIQEKDQQIEEALKRMDFAEEDYLWLLRKKMRDLRLKYHPDKITDRTATDEDYKFYERITKAYDVLCTKEERDKYLEMSNHVEWLQQHGEEEEARLVEKAIYDMETQKKVKKEERNEEESTQPPREHVERAKKKLQERREEETWEKAGEKIKALTLGTPNKCKAPVVTAQRFADRLEQCWIDIEWVCKCAYASAERIEYELRVQAIDKGAEDWSEVYHGWESSVAGLGPFPVGTYEFMVRARNSVGWGEWSDVIIVTLNDPKWEKQQRREAEQQVLREQAKTVQWDVQQILDEFEGLQGENKLTIHRASNLLFQLQAELKRARACRAYMAKPAVLREAEAAVRQLEKWRDRKEAFAEWKQTLSEMKGHLLLESPPAPAATGDGEQEGVCDLSHFLSQDEHYFGSLRPEIRNLIVQTLLGLDAKPVFKKLTPAQKEQIMSVLRRGAELGRAPLPPGAENEAGAGKKDAAPTPTEKNRTIFTKHQTEQLLKLAERFAGAHCRAPAAPPSPRAAALAGDQGSTDNTVAEETAERSAAEAQAPPSPRPAVSSASPASPRTPVPEEQGWHTTAAQIQKDKSEKRVRTVYIVGLPHREQVTRTDLVGALRQFAEVDGARVGAADALVRFTTPDMARAALAALERGGVALRRSMLSGRLAASDLLTEESLLKASGKTLPEKRPTPATPSASSKAPPAQQSPASQQPQAQHPPQQQQQPLQQQLQQKRPQQSHQGQQPALQERAEQAQQHLDPIQRLVRPSQPSQPSQPSTAPARSTPSLPAWSPARQLPREVLEQAQASAPAFQGLIHLTKVPDKPPRIAFDQLLNTDGSTNMFECPLCKGVAFQPKVVMCCQKVFCGECLDAWLQTSSHCHHCNSALRDQDGSTGGCSEQRVKRLDRNSNGVQAVLWRVYGNLRMSCDNGWTGNILQYSDHVAQQLAKAGRPQGSMQAPRPAQPRQEVAQPRQEPIPSTSAAPSEPKRNEMNGNFTVVMEHRAADPSQLSLTAGDQVFVQQVAAHGWVYGHRLTPGPSGSRQEGWFPSFCLPEKRPPPTRPQQSPPPMSPPTGSTQVLRDYQASDPNQLSVREGELVRVRQKDASGWTFVVRVSAQGPGKREGWVPDWCI